MKPLINCDMGESFGHYTLGKDPHVMPFIDMANLACGFHAGDSRVMHESVKLAKQFNVSISAHPSYPDKEGFGRRSMQCSAREIEDLLLYQIGALKVFCDVHSVPLNYIKPHGALYHDMMNNKALFETIIQTIASYDQQLKLVIFSQNDNNDFIRIADHYGITLLFEVFLDRHYQEDGSLVPRQEPFALIQNPMSILERFSLLTHQGYIKTHKGSKLTLPCDTLCLHGDNPTIIESLTLLHNHNES